MARFGNQTIIKNNMTPEEFEKWQSYFVDNFEKKKAKINENVQLLREKIAMCEPLQILKYCRDMVMMSQMGKHSEVEYSEDENISIRVLEYIQSVIVSTEMQALTFHDNNEQERHMIDTVAQAVELYKEINSFYPYWGHYVKKNGIVENELLDFIVESQNFYLVRGNRYQVFQLEPLKKLLPPHNDILIDIFNVSAEQIIDGLNKMEYSLSQGRADAWNDIIRSFRKFQQETEVIMTKNENSLEDLNSYYDEYFCKPEESLLDSFEGAFGLSLNDVKAITDWDYKLIKALTFSINECSNFFDKSEFSGWPIVELPTNRKPFIEIDGISYCFNYYSLFDNFYRIIQKEITKHRPDYKEKWKLNQAQASEDMVEELFCKLLPGAQTYKSNYYPKSTSLKQLNENDLLVLYDDVLLIIEIKAGSFPQTPPIVDYAAHIQSYKTLIEKADHQCDRTLQYIQRSNVATFYTSDKNEKVVIDKNKIREIFTFSVTVDNINELAARAEKTNFLNLKSNTISISYDDLLSYAEYFDSPLYFLHFLQQRKLATTIKTLSLKDELDHLGMYINYNVYSITAAEISDSAGRVFYTGFREELDNYLCRLYLPEIAVSKPLQKIPLLIKDMIHVMNVHEIPQRRYLSTFLLNLSSKAKDELVNSIEQTFNRKLSLVRPLPLVAFGGVRYCLFINIDGMPDMSYEGRRDYVYATALRNTERSLTWIDLFVDKSLNILRVEGCECLASDIDPSDYDRIYKLSLEYAKSRIDTTKRHSKKIGRNDYCPCGSEKKFKWCCINQ